MPTADQFLDEWESEAVSADDFLKQFDEPVEIDTSVRNLPNQQLATQGGPPLSLPSGAAKSVLSEVGGEVGQFVENVHTPTFELAEPLTLEERNFLKSESKGTQRAAGVYESLANTANFFTSPMGIATLGIGFLPRTAQKVAAGLFAIQMGKAVPEIATQLGEELGKPESERDQTKIAELITTGATTTGFAYLTGRHALKPTPKAIKLAEEIDAAEFTPRESTPAPVRELGIPQASLTAEPFLQPGVRGMASDALREAQSPINVGQPALEALRREIQPPVIVKPEPTRLAERIEGGGQSPYGKLSFMREAEAPLPDRTQQVLRQEALAKGRPPETIQPTPSLTRTGELGQGGGVKPELTKDDVVSILQSHNRLITDRQKIADKWLPSEKYVQLEIPVDSVFPAQKVRAEDKSFSEGPIIVDENTQGVGRFEGQFGAPPDVIIVDGKHRHAEAIARGEKTITAMVGDKALPKIQKAIADFTKKQDQISKAVAEYKQNPNGTTLRAMQAVLGAGEVSKIRQEVKESKSPTPPTPLKAKEATALQPANEGVKKGEGYDYSNWESKEQVLGTWGGSHRLSARQKAKFDQAGIPWSQKGPATLGSKKQSVAIPNTPEALRLLKEVGGTIARQQWDHLTKGKEKYTIDLQSRSPEQSGLGAGAAPKTGKIAPTEAAPKIEGKSGEIDAAFAGLAKQTVAFFNRVKEQVARGERVTFTKPKAIELARKDPRYQLKDNPDGSVDVVGIVESQPKIEGMGGAKTPVQTLSESRMVNVKVPEGATRIRVTDNRGRISVTTLDNVNKGANVFQRTDVAKIEAGIIGKDGKFKPVEGEVTVSERALKTASEKLEALKFKADKQGRVIPDDPGQVFSLPHPDAIKQISKQLWNDSIDLAIKAIQTGKTVAQAIDAAVKKIAYNAKGFDEAKIRENLASVLQEEGRPKPKSVPTTPQTQATPTTPVQIPGTTTHPIKASIKSNLTAQRGLPDVAFDAWVKRQGTVQEQVNRTAHGVRELYRALADQYGIGFVRRAFKGLSDVPPADVRMMNDYLRGKTDAPMPNRLREPLDRLRAHIDALSNRMIQEGLVNDKLALTIDANLGSYLRRSYKVFDDPKWGLDKLTPESQQKVVNGMLEELRKTNPNATVQDALNNIEAVVNEYKLTGEQEIMFGKSRTIGGKDLSLFLKRKDLSDWWKTMMGEYETPVMNYAKSISKMARFVADQTFLKEVEKAGVGSFLFKEPTAGHTSRIAAEGNKALEPISQYYTTPEIAKAFREFYDKPSEAHPVWRFIMGVTYASKGAKTVGSFLTQARNLLGQPFFWARNGHFDVREAMPAVKAVFADVAGKEGKWLEYYRDAIKHGVANESAQVGELRTVLKDVVGPRDADMPVDLLAGRSVWNMGKRVVLDPAERMYRTSDEIGKLVGWEIEKWYESRIHPEWTEAQVKAEAAKRVRNLYPTYSMISRMVKSAGKQPVFGPFMSFPAETIRTSYWAGKYALADLKSPNPYARMRGAKALVGMMAVYGGTFALASFFRQANNITKDQDDDVRRFMPDWSKNSQLLFTGPIKDGKADYINLSYINPYSYLTDPILAVAAGDDENYDERFWRAASEFVRPFTSEQMGAAAVMDLLRNQTESGRRVYNPEEETPQQIRDAAKHLLMPIVPGTIERAQKKIIPAALGEQPTTGQELSLKRELVSELTGIKSEGLDFQTAIARKLRTFAKAEKDVENIWVSRLFSGGKLPPEKIVSEYQRMNALRNEAWSELRQDSLAAIRLGVDDAKITTLLTGAGISNEQRRKIMAGDYEPYSPSVDLLKKALERHDIPEATFDGNTDGWLKLVQAKAEVSGNKVAAARARKFISELQSQRTLKTKVEKGSLEPDRKQEVMNRIDANISRLEALARERVE